MPIEQSPNPKILKLEDIKKRLEQKNSLTLHDLPYAAEAGIKALSFCYHGISNSRAAFDLLTAVNIPTALLEGGLQQLEIEMLRLHAPFRERDAQTRMKKLDDMLMPFFGNIPVVIGMTSSAELMDKPNTALLRESIERVVKAQGNIFIDGGLPRIHLVPEVLKSLQTRDSQTATQESKEE